MGWEDEAIALDEPQAAQTVESWRTHAIALDDQPSGSFGPVSPFSTSPSQQEQSRRTALRAMGVSTDTQVQPGQGGMLARWDAEALKAANGPGTRFGDVGITAAKGVVGLGQAAVGLLDLVAPKGPGEMPQELRANLGMDPQETSILHKAAKKLEGTQEYLHDQYSPETRQAHANFGEAKGFLNKIGAALSNPSVIATTVGESIPSMLAGGLIGKGLGVLGKAGGWLSKGGFAAGEGAMTAGSIQGQSLAESKTGSTTLGQKGLAVGGGALTGIVSIIGSKAASWLGVDDIDKLLAGNVSKEVKQTILSRAIASALASDKFAARAAGKSAKAGLGAAQEGLEELAQSTNEQIMGNLAQGKPWDEGLDQAGVMGLLSGGVMGGGVQLRPSPRIPVNVSDVANKVAQRMASGGKGPSRSEAKTLGMPPEIAKDEMSRAMWFEDFIGGIQDAQQVESPTEVDAGGGAQSDGRQEGGGVDQGSQGVPVSGQETVGKQADSPAASEVRALPPGLTFTSDGPVRNLDVAGKHVGMTHIEDAIPEDIDRVFPGYRGDARVRQLLNIFIKDSTPTNKGKGFGRAIFLDALSQDPNSWLYGRELSADAVGTLGALRRDGLVEVVWKKHDAGRVEPLELTRYSGDIRNWMARLTDKGRAYIGISEDRSAAAEVAEQPAPKQPLAPVTPAPNVDPRFQAAWTTPEENLPPTPTEPPDGVGIQHAYTEMRRMQTGMDERTPWETQKWEESAREADALPAEQITSLIDSLRANPRAVDNQTAQFVLLRRMVEVENAWEAAVKSGDEKAIWRTGLQRADIYRISELTGSIEGSVLNARKAFRRNDGSLVSVSRRMMEATGGNPLTPEQTKQAAFISKRLTAAQEMVDKAKTDPVDEKIAEYSAEADAAQEKSDNMTLARAIKLVETASDYGLDKYELKDRAEAMAKNANVLVDDYNRALKQAESITGLDRKTIAEMGNAERDVVDKTKGLDVSAIEVVRQVGAALELPAISEGVQGSDIAQAVVDAIRNGPRKKIGWHKRVDAAAESLAKEKGLPPPNAGEAWEAPWEAQGGLFEGEAEPGGKKPLAPKEKDTRKEAAKRAGDALKRYLKTFDSSLFKEETGSVGEVNPERWQAAVELIKATANLGRATFEDFWKTVKKTLGDVADSQKAFFASVWRDLEERGELRDDTGGYRAVQGNPWNKLSHAEKTNAIIEDMSRLIHGMLPQRAVRTVEQLLATDFRHEPTTVPELLASLRDKLEDPNYAQDYHAAYLTRVIPRLHAESPLDETGLRNAADYLSNVLESTDLRKFRDRVGITQPPQSGKKTLTKATRADATDTLKQKWAAFLRTVDIVSGEQGSVGNVSPDRRAAAIDLIKATLDLGRVTFDEFWAKVKRAFGDKAASHKSFLKAVWDDMDRQGDIPARVRDTDSPQELGPAAKAILKSVIEDGTREREPALQKVLVEMQRINPEITRDDVLEAIGDYGSFKPLDKNPAKRAYNWIRGEVQGLLKLRDASAGKGIPLFGRERDKPSLDQRRFIKEVNEFKRKQAKEARLRGEVQESDPGKARNALESRKTYLKNRMDDMNWEMENHRLMVREKTDPGTDKAYQKLQADYAALKEHWDQAFPKVKTPLSDEQRIQHLERALTLAEQQLTRDLQQGLIGRKTKGKPLTSAVIEAKRTAIEALRREREAMRANDPKFQASEDERWIANRLVDLARRQAKLAAINADMERTGKVPKKKLTKERPVSQALVDAQDSLAKEQKRERDILRKIRWDNYSPTAKAWVIASELGNFVPRALTTAFDYSATFLQGGFYSFAHPIEAHRAAWQAFKAGWKENSYVRAQEEIRQRTNYQNNWYKKGKLDIVGNEGTLREEPYLSEWANKIPGIAGSERAFVTYLNQVRVNTFDRLIEGRADPSRPPSEEELLAAGAAANIFSGRGSFGKFAAVFDVAAKVLFSPRLWASRIQTIAGVPIWKAPKGMRGAVAMEYVRYFRGLSMLYGMALLYGGLSGDDVEIELDPRSTDFLKIRIGNHRLDPLSGFQQHVVYFARTGATMLSAMGLMDEDNHVKTASGEFRSLRGDSVKYGQNDWWDATSKYVRSKLGPFAQTTTSMLTGEDPVGNEFTWSDIPDSLFVPLSISGAWDTYESEGPVKGTIYQAGDVVGIRSQNYAPDTPKDERERKGPIKRLMRSITD